MSGDIVITLLPREDGGLRVCSTTHPGLILSGPDPVKVMSDVWPALKVLEEYRGWVQQQMKQTDEPA